MIYPVSYTHLDVYKRQSKDRLEDLQKELAELRDSFSSQKAQWENEKSSVDKLSKLREEIEHING